MTFTENGIHNLNGLVLYKLDGFLKRFENFALALFQLTHFPHVVMAVWNYLVVITGGRLAVARVDF